MENRPQNEFDIGTDVVKLTIFFFNKLPKYNKDRNDRKSKCTVFYGILLLIVSGFTIYLQSWLLNGIWNYTLAHIDQNVEKHKFGPEFITKPTANPE